LPKKGLEQLNGGSCGSSSARYDGCEATPAGEQSVAVTLDRRAVVSVVGLEGEVDIRAAVELKGILLAALESRQELRLEMAGLTALDITILQLLCAFARAAAKAGAKLILSEPMPKAMEVAMDLAGMGRVAVVTQ
jgi:anti-anti-sigma factor